MLQKICERQLGLNQTTRHRHSDSKAPTIHVGLHTLDEAVLRTVYVFAIGLLLLGLMNETTDDERVQFFTPSPLVHEVEEGVGPAMRHKGDGVGALLGLAFQGIVLDAAEQILLTEVKNTKIRNLF
jgi:hypothetical protein